MGIGSSQASKKTGSLRKAAGCLRRHNRRAGTGGTTRLVRPLSAPRRRGQHARFGVEDMRPAHVPANGTMREVDLDGARSIAVRCLKCDFKYSLSRRVRKVAQE